MGKKKIAGTKNVYELAQERLKVIFNEFDNIFCRVYLRTNLVIEVGTVKGRLEHLGIQHIQVFLNIVLDFRGSGCR